MKNISEYIVDSDFEQYLINDIEQLLLCNYIDSDFIFEDLEYPKNIFQNYKIILDIIMGYIKKINKNFKNNDIIKIPINSVQDYPKKIEIQLYHNENRKEYKDFCSGTITGFKNNIVYIDLKLGENFRYCFQQIRMIILHELLHGYEDYIRKNEGLPSIFDEFIQGYSKSKNHINDDEYIVKYISILKYFFNEHEQFAYMGTLEEKLENILNRIKPNYSKLKYKDVIKELQKEYVWKQYFNFGKFTANIDNISDNDLEDAYTFICEIPEEAAKRDKERYELFKKYKLEGKIPPKREKYIEKSATEIRKECKEKWLDFKSEFDCTFVDLFNKALTKNLK